MSVTHLSHYDDNICYLPWAEVPVNDKVTSGYIMSTSGGTVDQSWSGDSWNNISTSEHNFTIDELRRIYGEGKTIDKWVGGEVDHWRRIEGDNTPNIDELRKMIERYSRESEEMNLYPKIIVPEENKKPKEDIIKRNEKGEILRRLEFN